LLCPERARVYSDLSPKDKDWYNADIRATNILIQGLPKDIYTLINHYTDANDIWDNVKMLLEGSELTKEDRESQLVDRIEVKQGRLSAATAMLSEMSSLMKALLIIAVYKTHRDEDVDEQPVQDLALNVDNVFQAEDYDAFDSDVDEGSQHKAMSWQIYHPQICMMEVGRLMDSEHTNLRYTTIDHIRKLFL
ncbi:hypothetical protein Tco_1445262, partial [Tanacetum coccineum]